MRWIHHGIVIFTVDSRVWQTITPPALKATIHEAVTAPRAEGDKQAAVGTAGNLDQGVDAIGNGSASVRRARACEARRMERQRVGAR